VRPLIEILDTGVNPWILKSNFLILTIDLLVSEKK
jgi:hypothetical protein